MNSQFLLFFSPKPHSQAKILMYQCNCIVVFLSLLTYPYVLSPSYYHYFRLLQDITRGCAP